MYLTTLGFHLKTGIDLLKEELIRLKSFSAAHRSNRHEIYEGVSVYEWEALWQYYDALRDALSHAIQSNVTLTEEVWKLDDNWCIRSPKKFMCELFLVKLSGSNLGLYEN